MVNQEQSNEVKIIVCVVLLATHLLLPIIVFITAIAFLISLIEHRAVYQLIVYLVRQDALRFESLTIMFPTLVDNFFYL